MLIKATRIRASAGAGALARHLTDADENEAVEIVQGAVADLTDAVADARRFSRTYALRHFIIAPQTDMNRGQFRHVVDMLGAEFGFDPATPLIVEHTKTRAVPGVAGRHWHVVVAETDPITGRVLSSRFDHARHEKIARQAEIQFGHPIIAGAHDLAVLAALRAEGNADLADQLATHLGQGKSPAAAFTSTQHQAAKRVGIDLALVRENIRAACADAPTGTRLRERLTAHGLALARGEKPGTWIVLGPDGQFLGAAHRLSGLRKGNFNKLMENDHDESRHHYVNERRPRDPEGYAGPAARHGDHSGTGPRHGIADAGRGNVGDRGDGRSIANDREANGAGRSEPRSASSETRSAGHRAGVEAHDRQRLRAAVIKTTSGIISLSKSATARSSAERTAQHLAALEMQARERIAAAEAKPEVAVSNRVHAARLYRDGTRAQHGKAVKDYRAAQERLAAHPSLNRSFADRLLRRKSAMPNIKVLERDVAAARAELIAAERAAANADAHLAKVEKAETAERAQRTGEMEKQRRIAMEMFAEVEMAQRMVRAFPGLAHSGPTFVAWSGSKIERKRKRELRNPWATNIWGIPLDFG